MLNTKTKGLSDSTLHALWRKAVRAQGQNRCIICGAWGQLECHHVIHRRYKLLRWDWRNGVPVCPGVCHDMADREGVGIAGDYAPHLRAVARVTFKQYLVDMELSEAEWRERVKYDLQQAIGGTDDRRI